MGNIQAPVLIETLYQQHRRYDRPTGTASCSPHTPCGTLCQSPKDRTSDDMVNGPCAGPSWRTKPRRSPISLEDMHTLFRPANGRDYRFFHGGSEQGRPRYQRQGPALPRDWIMATLDAGKLT